MTVMADAVCGMPASRLAMRATFIPCSASGIAQPRMTSSTISGFTAGTRASAPLMAAAARSSGRVCAQRPLARLPHRRPHRRNDHDSGFSARITPRLDVHGRQFRSGLPSLSMCWMRVAGLLACPAATGRPRARGRGSAARWPRPARGRRRRGSVATLVATSASCSLMCPPRSALWMPILKVASAGRPEHGDVRARPAGRGSRRGPGRAPPPSRRRAGGRGSARASRPGSGTSAAPPRPRSTPCANAIRSKARFTNGNGSAPSTPAAAVVRAQRHLLGAAARRARGRRPTSTRPM